LNSKLGIRLNRELKKILIVSSFLNAAQRSRIFVSCGSEDTDLSILVFLVPGFY